ncbi:MAG: tRNA 4-thiouridine(8) synthase ThiI [Patescibacteria group bacterium]|nr:tRNA 4-thiouridine(8) synthase ThiI [Patescibacteria group bacterium]
MSKALLLFSGGLDSSLAYKILESQGVDVTALFFRTHFFDEEAAREIAEANEIKLRVENVGDEHLAIVKAPKFGRGSGMNPCIDCHLFMIRKAKEIMEREGFDFLATGEVLGQRPMSQNLGSMMKIEREAGLAGKIVRPLSAKALPETEAEEKGQIRREKLFDIRGRSRGTQFELADKFGIKKFQTPAGGCLLTDPDYSRRLKELSEHWPDYTADDADILRHGRVFWHGENMIVVARDAQDCKMLIKIAKPRDIVLELADIVGPTVIIRGKAIDDSAIEKAKELLMKYSPKVKGIASPEFKITKI